MEVPIILAQLIMILSLMTTQCQVSVCKTYKLIYHDYGLSPGKYKIGSLLKLRVIVCQLARNSAPVSVFHVELSRL